MSSNFDTGLSPRPLDVSIPVALEVVTELARHTDPETPKGYHLRVTMQALRAMVKCIEEETK